VKRARALDLGVSGLRIAMGWALARLDSNVNPDLCPPMHLKSRAKFSQYAADCLTTPERLQDRISIFGHLTTVFNPLPAKRVLRAVPVRKPDKDLDAAALGLLRASTVVGQAFIAARIT
jgi:hypothetical protein